MGPAAPEAYNRQIQGSEVLLRSWSDRTRSPLSNKYDWYLGGSLSLAIKQLTGNEPEWFLSDVRDPDRASLVAAEDALQRDYRVRLFNRKWIEGMMKEGYAGADQIAVHVSNTMGWKIMREGSVSDDVWNEIAAIYVKDKLALAMRQWFERENPFAFQDMSEVLLESSRKGFWKAEPGLLREVAEQYARSVVQHGEGGGLRGGGNQSLEQFVAATLQSANSAELDQLAVQYQDRIRAAVVAPPAQVAGTAPGAKPIPVNPEPMAAAQTASTPKAPDLAAAPTSAPKPPTEPGTVSVRAKRLEPSPSADPASQPQGPGRWPLPMIIAAVCLVLLVAGFSFRRGLP